MRCQAFHRLSEVLLGLIQAGWVEDLKMTSAPQFGCQ